MCNTKEKLKAVTEANKMLVDQIEWYEGLLEVIQVMTDQDEIYAICSNALEISNDR